MCNSHPNSVHCLACVRIATEESPSFAINVQSGLCYCFGRVTSCALINYAMPRNSLDFETVIHDVATQAGSRMEEQKTQAPPKTINLQRDFISLRIVAMGCFKTNYLNTMLKTPAITWNAGALTDSYNAYLYWKPCSRAFFYQIHLKFKRHHSRPRHR